jgi:hypothetical protein
MSARPRRKPYTSRGITRMACWRCGERASFHWNVCADGNVYRPVCTPCDVALNDLVLCWAGDPDRKAKMTAYRARVGGWA